MKRISLLVFLACCLLIPTCFAMETLVYMLRSHTPVNRSSTPSTALQSLQQHYKSITILSPQAYQINDKGVVTNGVDAEVLAFSRTNNVKLMVLVTNRQFDTQQVHSFLANPEAQQKAIHSLVDLCEKNHFYGVQLDFEMVDIKDKAPLTAFFLAATQALHEHHMVVSLAIAPVVSDHDFPTVFLRKVYEHWQGAYDLPALANSADFFTVMAYNQHEGKTTPGSTATLPWVEATLQYTLQYIKPEKISLGIPAFSTFWFLGQDPQSGKLSAKMADIPYQKVQSILEKNKASLVWNKTDKINYAVYQRGWLNQYLFVEDAKSFKAKLALVKKYHLRGISIFDIGSEDPDIWSVLK